MFTVRRLTCWLLRMAEKRKRSSITLELKREIIIAVENNPTKKKSDIAKDFKIPPSTLATILKNKEKFEQGSAVLNSIFN